MTGSVGKTGTKEMLRACLSRLGPTHAPEKSFNNHWGVPLTLARMPATTRYAVLEIGMNHPGEIAPLAKLTRPHVAIVTTVEPVHLGFFDSVEQIADAKAEMGADWAGGFLCPCHGSKFDLAGRVYKGAPAPINLEVPPHMYLSEGKILIGEDKKGA